jgi:hypothetical protein
MLCLVGDVEKVSHAALVQLVQLGSRIANSFASSHLLSPFLSFPHKGEAGEKVVTH